MKKKLFILLAIVMFLIGTALNANALTFYDGFEAQSFDPFWTNISQTNGTVTLSTEQPHSGLQSAKFIHERVSGQKHISLSHTFSDVVSGNISVWFYDSRMNGVYSFLATYNSTVTNYPEAGSLFSIGVMDYNDYNYFSHSPDSNGVTPISRTLGWHEFKINMGATGGEMYIDDVIVNSFTGDHGFDSVCLYVSGPRYASGTFYYDDFSITTPVPEPATMLLLGTGLIGLRLYRKKKGKV